MGRPHPWRACRDRMPYSPTAQQLTIFAVGEAPLRWACEDTTETNTPSSSANQCTMDTAPVDTCLLLSHAPRTPHAGRFFPLHLAPPVLTSLCPDSGSHFECNFAASMHTMHAYVKAEVRKQAYRIPPNRPNGAQSRVAKRSHTTPSPSSS